MRQTLGVELHSGTDARAAAASAAARLATETRANAMAIGDSRTKATSKHMHQEAREGRERNVLTITSVISERVTGGREMKRAKEETKTPDSRVPVKAIVMTRRSERRREREFGDGIRTFAPPFARTQEKEEAREECRVKRDDRLSLPRFLVEALASPSPSLHSNDSNTIRRFTFGFSCSSFFHTTIYHDVI